MKETAKERLAGALRQTITLPVHQLHWEEEGKELLIEGRMFDVVTIVYKGAQAIVTGIYDDAETGIIERLQNEGARSGQTASIIQLLLLSQCFVFLISPLTVSGIRKVFIQIYAVPVPQYVNPYRTVISPPPRHFK